MICAMHIDRKMKLYEVLIYDYIMVRKNQARCGRMIQSESNLLMVVNNSCI